MLLYLTPSGGLKLVVDNDVTTVINSYYLTPSGGLKQTYFVSVFTTFSYLTPSGGNQLRIMNYRSKKQSVLTPLAETFCTLHFAFCTYLTPLWGIETF